MQLARLTDEITRQNNLNKVSTLTTIDLTKAFDLVWHNGLIHKLISLNYPPSLIKIIQNYLSKRSIKIRYNNTLSNERSTTTGVPQGGVLSAHLFIIYTHDIPHSPYTTLALFADDTAILSHSYTTKQSTKTTQRHLDKLQIYFHKWRLIPNPSKSSLTHFTKKTIKHKPPLILDNENIPETPETKYLGIILDRRLTFNSHFKKTLQKANACFQTLLPILSNKSKISTSVKSSIYKSCLRPILTYGSPIWSLASPSTQLKFQKFQNKILRVILNAPKSTKTTILHQSTNTEPISTHVQKLNSKFYNYQILASDLTKSIHDEPILRTYFKNNYKIIADIPI
jgi:hypothetical protein